MPPSNAPIAPARRRPAVRNSRPRGCPPPFKGRCSGHGGGGRVKHGGWERPVGPGIWRQGGEAWQSAPGGLGGTMREVAQADQADAPWVRACRSRSAPEGERRVLLDGITKGEELEGAQGHGQPDALGAC